MSNTLHIKVSVSQHVLCFRPRGLLSYQPTHPVTGYLQAELEGKVIPSLDATCSHFFRSRNKLLS